MVPIARRASYSNKKCCIFLVQDTSAGEAGKGEEAKRRRLEATSTATSTGTFTAQARKSSDS